EQDGLGAAGGHLFGDLAGGAGGLLRRQGGGGLEVLAELFGRALLAAALEDVLGDGGQHLDGEVARDAAADGVEGGRGDQPEEGKGRGHRQYLEGDPSRPQPTRGRAFIYTRAWRFTQTEQAGRTGRDTVPGAVVQRAVRRRRAKSLSVRILKPRF